VYPFYCQPIFPKSKKLVLIHADLMSHQQGGEEDTLLTDLRLGLAKTALLVPLNLTNTIDARARLIKEQPGWGENSSWWVDKLLHKSVAGYSTEEKSVPIWEMEADEDDEGELYSFNNRINNKRITSRLRMTREGIACLFGKEEDGREFLLCFPTDIEEEEESNEQQIFRSSGERKRGDDNFTSSSTIKAKVEGVSLAIHSGGSAVLIIKLAWSRDSTPSLFDLRPFLTGLSEKRIDKIEWYRRAKHDNTRRRTKGDESKGKEKEDPSSSRSSSSLSLSTSPSSLAASNRPCEAHLTSLGKLAEGVYQGVGVSFADLADWLVGLPTEPPSFPARRVNPKLSLFHHTFIAIAHTRNEPILIKTIDAIFNEFQQSPLGGIAPNALSRAVISKKSTMALSWPSTTTPSLDRQRGRRLCESWMETLLDILREVFLNRDTLQRIAKSSLHLSRLWRQRKRNFEERRRAIPPGEWTEREKLDFFRLEEEDDEELTREINALIAWCSRVKMHAIVEEDDIIVQQWRVHQPAFADRFRAEYQRAIGVSTIAEKTKRYLRQQLGTIQQAMAATRRFTDRRRRDIENDQFLVSEMKRRKFEMILQSVSAVSVPLFLVTNYFGMNTPDIPQIFWWYLIIATLGAGAFLITILVLVWCFYFLDRKRLRRRIRRLYRRIERMVTLKTRRNGDDRPLSFRNEYADEEESDSDSEEEATTLVPHRRSTVTGTESNRTIPTGDGVYSRLPSRTVSAGDRNTKGSPSQDTVWTKRAKAPKHDTTKDWP